MYYDVLAKIKNAAMAEKERMILPFSRMDFAVVSALAEAGYLKNVERETLGRRQVINVRLAYKGKESVFTDFKLVSKPSRHSYIDYRKLRPVKQGHGLAVLSTSRGIMTDRQARKNKVGGEYLFEIW